MKEVAVAIIDRVLSLISGGRREDIEDLLRSAKSKIRSGDLNGAANDLFHAQSSRNLPATNELIDRAKLEVVGSSFSEVDDETGDGREDYAVDITEALLIRAVELVSPVNAALLGARAVRALSRGAKNLLVRLGTEVASGIKSAAQARREAAREPELLQLVPLSEGGMEDVLRFTDIPFGGNAYSLLVLLADKGPLSADLLEIQGIRGGDQPSVLALLRDLKSRGFVRIAARGPGLRQREVPPGFPPPPPKRLLARSLWAITNKGEQAITDSFRSMLDLSENPAPAEHFTSQDDIIREIRSLRGRHPEAREHLDVALRYLDAPLNDGSRLHVGAALNRAADVFWDAELEDLAGRTVDMLASVSPEMFRDVGYTE